MQNLNEERNKLLSSADMPELFDVKNSIKDLVNFFDETFNPLDLSEIISKMGIEIRYNEKDMAILKEAPSSVVFTLNIERDSAQTKQNLLRLLGVYLFTDEMSNNEYYLDKRLSAEDERNLDLFYILFVYPDFDVNSYIPIQDLVKISIEKNIPLPLLRNTLYL